MNPTLKDVAEAAGVSIRTAGRALRQSGPVRDEVAKRVMDAAKKLAYVPNAAARNLRSRSSRIVGVFVPRDSMQETVRFRLGMLEQELRDHSFNTLLGALPTSERELEEILHEWYGIVRTIVFLSWNPQWNSDLLKRYHIRFIFVDCDPGSDQFYRLLTDRTSGVTAAVSALIASGKRRIIHATSDGVVGRAPGFERAIRDAKENVESQTLKFACCEFADGYFAGEEIMAWNADAVFFGTDRMALGFYRFAHEHGIRIPQDVAVAGFDDDRVAAFAIPALTTVAHPSEEAIRKAIEIVMRKNETPETIVYPTKLIARESIS